MTPAYLDGLRTLAERMMAYYRIPGCAMAVLDRDDTYFLSFGTRDIETKAPFGPDTVSGIGSCTKSMTAAAALCLEEKGLLDIDAPIASYLPGFALWDEHASALCTVRDMLCHRTGVAGHDGAWPDNSISRVEFLKRLKYLEPNASFRTAAQYSNVMYAAAGGVMEAVTGKPWETILEEELFRPLGMTHTHCLMGDAEREDDLAAPHWWRQGLHKIPRWNIDQGGPCGSVMSTARDMARWLAFHIRGGLAPDGAALLTPSHFLDMHRPQILMDYPHVLGGRSLGYGLGWRVMEYHGHIVQQHTGKIEGYSAFQFYLPGLGRGAVYLQNLHAPDNPFIFAVQGYLLDAFTGRSTDDWYRIYTERRAHAPEDMYHHLEHDCMPESVIPGTQPSRRPAAYCGVYEHPGYGRFRVRWDGERLLLDERGVTGLVLTHVHYDTFRVEGVKEDTDLYTLPLTFEAAPDGTIAGFIFPLEPKVAPVRFRKMPQ